MYNVSTWLPNRKTNVSRFEWGSGGTRNVLRALAEQAGESEAVVVRSD